MKPLFSSFITILLSCSAKAQTADYFQQEVNYTIDVTLDDQAHLLRGFIQFEYINNSPDTLHELFIHLWPNAYKNAKTAMSKQKMRGGDYFMLWASQKDKGYIDSIDFKVNNTKADWQYFQNYEDIAILFLDQPLLSGQRLTVSTPFKVKLPSGSISRLGHVGESYQITQWYPKPAVYDVDGWHEMPYLTQGEFYSEFGSYDVCITLPSNYVVGATGDLQNEEEQKWLDELSLKVVPEKKTQMVDGKEKDLRMEFPPSSAITKTLHYQQTNVHDFGWFADKRWIVRKGEVEMPNTKKKVTTYAMFTAANAEEWEKVGIKSINDGLYYYSLYSGDYPYNYCTAVDGTISAGGGMEYPNVTVIGNSGNVQGLATVIIHEVGHNWFYGILGSNERDNAWMDEGINSFFETRALLKSMPDANALGAIGIDNEMLNKRMQSSTLSYQYLTEELAYLLSARGNKDQPIQMPSEYYTNMNYGTIVYKKTAIAFNYLMQYLGEEMMNKCMAAYFEKWKFKHPGPQDIREVFEKTSSKDLSWFFDTLINTKGRVDAQASMIKKRKGKYVLTLFNNGDIASPVGADVMREGKMVSRTWFDGFEAQTWKSFEIDAKRGDIIKLNNIDGIPEIDKKNNTIRTKGPFKRIEPLKLKMLTGVDDPNHTQLFWNPLVAWNEYNKWMVGVQLHNKTIPTRNFTWSAAPMYSLVTNNVNGFASIESYNGKIGLGARAQKFSYETREVNDDLRVYSYQMLVPYVRANLFSSRLEKNWSGELKAEYFIMASKLKKSKDEFEPQFTNMAYEETIYGNNYGAYEDENVNHIRIKAHAKKKMLRSELRFESSVEGGDYTDFALFHQHALSYDYVYRGKGKKKIRTRFYYGGGNKVFNLSTNGQNGTSDYIYDGLFLGRSQQNGLLSQQFLRTQGGLAVPYADRFNRHLLSANVELDLPLGLPLGIYIGAAYGESSSGRIDEIYVAGVSVPLIRNVFEVYVPLLYSQNVKDALNSGNTKFGETIMFQLNLNLVNPFDLIKKAEL